MEFEVLKRGYIKRNIIIGLIAVLLISAVILNFTRAKYRTTAEVPIANGTINYSAADLNIVSVYIENEEGVYEIVDTIPEFGYTLNIEQSYCGISNNGEIEKDAAVTIQYENGLINVLGISKRGTKCYFYFDEQHGAGDQILVNYTTVLTRDDFSTILGDTTTGTIYKSLDETQYDDDGEVYYFAGNPTDNWVYFAGFYWRIIRINGDGSIRLIYNGTTTATTGVSTQIGTSSFNTGTNPIKVGYTYEESLQRTNSQNGGTASIIKGVLDNWYNNNLENFSDFIEQNAKYCNDRTLSEGSVWTSEENFIGDSIHFAGYTRKEETPTFKCPAGVNSSDLYTLNIGLITLDEVRFAGAYNYTENTQYYLYTG